ncbi:MAG: hypothetical protein ACYTHN_12870 [Planctomycetota bacterium]|jgi:hypothetical protein
MRPAISMFKCFAPSIAAVLLLCGCGVSAPLMISKDPQIAELKKQVRERGWTLHPGEIIVDAAKINGGDDWALSVDMEIFQAEVLDALDKAGVFRRVVREHGAMKEEEHSLLLTIRVVKARGKSLGKNGNFLPNLLFWWLLSPFAASYVADEDFEGTLAVEVTLEEPGNATPIWKGTVSSTFKASLDHFQRGITLLDLLPTAPLTASTDSEDVSDVLGPHLYRKIEVALIKKLSAELPPPEVDFLVSVGCAPPAGTKAEGADETGVENVLAIGDARKFAETFKRGEGRKEVLLLTDRDKSADSVRKILSDLADDKSIRGRDFILLFAGCGTLVPDTPGKSTAAICFEDGNSIKVSELLELVGTVPASSRCVILDTGFKGKGPRVSGTLVPPAPKSGTVSPFPSKRTLPCLLSACGPESPGAEIVAAKHGALTTFLVPLLEKKGDADGDGLVKASEVFSEILWKMSRKVRMADGRSLVPHLLGDAVLWRCKSKKPK